MSDARAASHLLSQFVRYAVVGLASNALLYLAYLGLTWLGLGHKLTMSLLYCVGMLQTFLLNRGWTFQHNGSARKALYRYVIVYGAGYALNFLALLLLVDAIGWPHQIVQGVMILVVACFLFVLQRQWVFSGVSRRSILRKSELTPREAGVDRSRC